MTKGKESLEENPQTVQISERKRATQAVTNNNATDSHEKVISYKKLLVTVVKEVLSSLKYRINTKD